MYLSFRRSLNILIGRKALITDSTTDTGVFPIETVSMRSIAIFKNSKASAFSKEGKWIQLL